VSGRTKAKKLDVEFSPNALKEIGRAVRIEFVELDQDADLRDQVLIEQAIIAIRPGSKAREEIGPGLRTYHLSPSRDRPRTETGKVANPRHFILYRVVEQQLKVVRSIHDSQDLSRVEVKP